MLALVMAGADELATALENQVPRQLFEKYTSGNTPKIHDEDPASLLAGLEKGQVNNWLNIATGKVLVRPFDAEVKYQPNHIHIAKSILTTAKDITGATEVAVARPNPKPKAAKQRKAHHPITFLIHEISKADEEILLSREVWSLKEITFQVSPINVRRPDFMFTLTGFVTDSLELVNSCIMDTWSDETTDKFLRKLANDAPTQSEQLERMSEIIEFLESATVQLLDIKREGSQADPHFNVYADGEIIKDHKTWIELWKFLKERTYQSTTIGEGKATKVDFICGLCYSHDHPRGLCQFLHVKGWNGGGRNPRFPNCTDPKGVTQPLNATRQWNSRPSNNTQLPQCQGGPSSWHP